MLWALLSEHLTWWEQFYAGWVLIWWFDFIFRVITDGLCWSWRNYRILHLYVTCVVLLCIAASKSRSKVTSDFETYKPCLPCWAWGNQNEIQWLQMWERFNSMYQNKIWYTMIIHDITWKCKKITFWNRSPEPFGLALPPGRIKSSCRRLKKCCERCHRPCRDHAETHQTHQTHQTLHQTMHLFLKLD